MTLINKLIVHFLPLLPKSFVYLFAKKYIAGPSLNEAIMMIKEFNARDILATMDILGEDVVEKEDALKVVDEYKHVLQEIDKNGVNANISVKPTHLGLKIDKDFCFQNIKTLLIEAQRYNNFVRIDMEDHTCTTDTIDIYLRLKKEFTNVGVVLQAYLRRTIEDINTIIKNDGHVRLCKGIYVEPSKIAYKDYEIINANFKYCLEKLLGAGSYVGIATHDEKLAWHAMSVIDKLQLSKNAYEFQMLLGVAEELRDIIVSAGHRLRVYIPFGAHWHAYSMRRLKENPRIAFYVIRHIFGKK